MKFKPLIFALLLGLSPLLSQRLPVQVYTTRDGMISNFVNALFQDSQGYLWIGTDEGISIFDGYKFRNVSLGDQKVWGVVNSIIESKYHPGEMWIATNGGGIIRYVAGEMTYYSVGENVEANKVNTLLETGEGTIWCATDDGLYRYHHGTIERSPITNIGKFAKFVLQADGVIWCFDEHKLSIFSPVDQKLFFHSNKDIPREDVIFASALPDTSIAVIVHDGDEKKATLLFVKNYTVTKRCTLPSRLAAFVLQDNKKKYWVGTIDGLLTMSDVGNDSSYRIFTTANGLPVNDLSLGMRDKEDNLWFGSFGRGLTKIDGEQSFQFSFPGMSGKGIADSRQHVWVPSSHGLYEVWRDGHQLWRKKLHMIKDQEEYLTPIAAAVDTNDNLWISFLDGSMYYYTVDRKNPNDSELKKRYVISPKNGFPQGLNIMLKVDSKNTLFYGINQGGIAAVDFSSTPKLIALYRYPEQTMLRDIRWLSQDRSGVLWALGYDPLNRTVIRKNNSYYLDSTNAVLKKLPAIPFRSTVQTSDGAYWFGSRYNGLFMVKGDSIRQWTRKDGMLSDQIWSVSETPTGGLLVGTQAGLMLIADRKNIQFTSLQHYTQSPVYTISSSPALSWALTRYELTLFDTPNESPNTEFPPVLITSMVVNGKDISVRQDIEFGPGENTVSIDYTSITFRNNGAMRFQYKLEPSEEEWREATTNRSVTYASLHPGDYFFNVRTVNQNGKVSEIPTILHFSIASPIWMRWWFVSLIALCTAGIVFGAERIRVRRLLEIEKIRSRIAADLHDDIGSGLTRIALLSDMIQRQSVSEKKSIDPEFTVPTLTEKVGAISRELVDAMSDVVWSIDPKNSSMHRLLQRVQTFAVEVCEAKEIELTMSITAGIEKLKVGSDSIRAVLLVAKEALTNVARHSNAKNVSLKIDSSGHELLIEITDDGKGFDITELSRMNGLTNMRVRIEKHNGTFTIDSAKGRGTMIKAVIPLPQ